MAPMRRNNDIGGESAGAVDRIESPVLPWQHRLDAMRRVLGDEKRRLVSLDEMRRAMEDLTPDQYQHLGFFDRRVLAIEAILVEKAVATTDEIDAEASRIIADADRAPDVDAQG